MKTIIKVNNPMYGEQYTVDMAEKEVKNAIYATNDYPDRFASFEAIDQCGNKCTLLIKASNFASVVIMESEMD